MKIREAKYNPITKKATFGFSIPSIDIKASALERASLFYNNLVKDTDPTPHTVTMLSKGFKYRKDE